MLNLHFYFPKKRMVLFQYCHHHHCKKSLSVKRATVRMLTSDASQKRETQIM